MIGSHIFHPRGYKRPAWHPGGFGAEPEYFFFLNAKRTRLSGLPELSTTCGPKMTTKSEEKPKRRKVLRLNILAKNARAKWHKIVNKELQKKGEPQNPNGYFYAYSFIKVVNEMKMTAKQFRDIVKEYKKTHTGDEFVALLTKCNLHRDRFSVQNKKKIVKQMMAAINGNGEGEADVDAGVVVAPAITGIVNPDSSFEKRMGHMLLTHMLYPFAKALQMKKMTTATLPEMLSKPIYKIMKVCYYLKMLLPVLLPVLLPKMLLPVLLH